jgi:hypothetical protein
VLHHQLVCWWTRGAYSHVELIIAEGLTGECLCASSSARDGGVRSKLMRLPTDKWDFVAVLATTEKTEQVWQWFKAREGKKYDYLAWFGFVWRHESGSKNRWFCSEAIAEALGYQDSWRFDPNTLYVSLKGRV